MIRMLLAAAGIALMLLFGGCTTPQERSGHNPKPFNTPAQWETNPYGSAFQN